MKLSLAYPVAGTQKLIEIDDDAKLCVFFFVDQRSGGADQRRRFFAGSGCGYFAAVEGCVVLAAHRGGALGLGALGTVPVALMHMILTVHPSACLQALILRSAHRG